MGFLSGLLKLGGLAAAPFTGGASAALTAGLGAAGQIAGMAGQGAAGQRMGENDQISQRNNQRLAAYNTQQNAMSRALENQSGENMQRAQWGVQSDRERARQSVLGSLMKNLQTSRVSSSNPMLQGRIPTYTGGLQASSVLDAMTRQQGQGLLQKALTAQQTGSDVPAATDFLKGVLTPPELEALKKSGLLEKILGAVGLAGSIAGGVASTQTPRLPVVQNTNLAPLAPSVPMNRPGG